MANDNDGVVSTEYQISLGQFKEITSFDDALALAKEVYGDESVVLASDAIGDGFALLDKDQKGTLVGTPMIFLKWALSEGDYVDQETGEKGEFAVVRAVTKDNKKIVFLDGGTGIVQQLKMFEADNFGRQGGLVAQKGLRVSEYDHPQYGKSKTYYIDTSAIA